MQRMPPVPLSCRSRSSPNPPQPITLWRAFIGRKAMGRGAGALAAAARLAPQWPDPMNNMAWILATHAQPELRNGPEAVKLATRAVELSRTNNATFLDTLAAAYAEAGQFAEATASARAAQTKALAQGRQELAEQIQQRLAGYAAPPAVSGTNRCQIGATLETRLESRLQAVRCGNRLKAGLQTLPHAEQKAWIGFTTHATGHRQRRNPPIANRNKRVTMRQGSR